MVREEEGVRGEGGWAVEMVVVVVREASMVRLGVAKRAGVVRCLMVECCGLLWNYCFEPLEAGGPTRNAAIPVKQILELAILPENHPLLACVASTPLRHCWHRNPVQQVTIIPNFRLARIAKFNCKCGAIDVSTERASP